MVMKSSSNLGTDQDNKTEITMSSRKPKANAARKAELAAKELVAEKLPDEVEASVDVNTDPVAEAAATVTTDDYAELLADGRECIDAIDEQILELVARRIEVAGELLSAKHTRGIDTRDKPRQNAIYERLIALSADFTERGVHLSKHQIRDLFSSLIRLGLDNHRQNIINRRRR